MNLLAYLCILLETTSRLAVISQAPDFALTTEKGAVLRLADLRGRVCLVSFVFTTCNGTCPATTARMSQVQRTLEKNGLLKDGQVQLLSITLDPERDTSEVLQQYMKRYDANPATWAFLTGEKAIVDKVVQSWGMWARPGANGQLDHPSRVFLVDQRGRIREIYNLDFFQPKWVLEDVRLLLSAPQSR